MIKIAYRLINKSLLIGDNFKPEMYLKHPGFNLSKCGPFSKNRYKIQ